MTKSLETETHEVEGLVIATPAKRSKALSSAADQTFLNIIIGLSSVVLIAVLLYGAVLITGGLPAFAQQGLGFLFGLEWNPGTQVFQALPFIAGTIFTAFGALLIAVPLSVASALFIAEYAPPWLAAPVGYLIELLAAIPSVVYGLWGIFVLIPAVRGFQTWFVGATGVNWTPLGTGLLSAILVLSVMVVPFICAIARDVIKLVPNDQREAAYALGATKWEVIRYGILPFARAGILGGVILGLGRAIGETLAVTMVIGNANQIATNPFASTATMSSIIASNFGEASDAMRPALIAMGFMLLVFSVVINAIARVVITKLTPVGTR
jgi:phosphate transport system permease protein